MDDLISRQQAIDAVNAMRFGMEKMAFEIITTKLLELPTIEPERQKGEWVPVTHGRGGYECNRCYEYAPTYHKEFLPNYCPNCGARMTISTN